MTKYAYKTYGPFTLSAAIDALKAHANGATDSGVSDETMRAWAVETLNAMATNDRRIFLALYSRDRYFNPAAIFSGYGLADVASLIEWLENQGVEI
jgi:hypothetical protein